MRSLASLVLVLMLAAAGATSALAGPPAMPPELSCVAPSPPDKPKSCEIAIAKSGAAAGSVGVPITYAVTVANTGQRSIPAAEIRVTDPLVSAQDLAPVRVVAGNGDGLLDPGEVWEYGLPGGAPPAYTPTACGPVVNTVAVAPLPGETYRGDNTATVTTQVACVLNLSASKSAHAATVVPGEPVLYTVTVSNTGTSPVETARITVSDPMVVLTPVAPVPAVLEPGRSVAFSGTRPTSAADCGPLVNTATVALQGVLTPESSTTDNTASATVTVTGPGCAPVVPPPVTTGGAPSPPAGPPTRLRIRKVALGTSLGRRPVPYRIVVRNVGTAVARDLVITDRIPAGMSLVRRPRGAVIRQGVVIWRIRAVAPGRIAVRGLWLRADANARRNRCNVARARAGNAPRVTGRVCLRFQRIVGVRRGLPVTG